MRGDEARLPRGHAFSKFLFRWIGALLTPLVLTKSGTKTVVFNAAPARACESDVRSARAPIDSMDFRFLSVRSFAVQRKNRSVRIL